MRGNFKLCAFRQPHCYSLDPFLIAEAYKHVSLDGFNFLGIRVVIFGKLGLIRVHRSHAEVKILQSLKNIE